MTEQGKNGIAQSFIRGLRNRDGSLLRSIMTEDVRDLTRPLWELAEGTVEGKGASQPPLVRAQQ